MNNGTSTGFTRGFSIFSAALLLLSLAVYLWVPAIKITPAYPYLLIFMYAFTLVIYNMLSKAISNRLAKFVNAYMLVNFGKLVLYCIIIFVYAWLNRDDAVSFILTFFIYYFLFTAYEITALLKSNKDI